MPLVQMISFSDSVPLWKIARKRVKSLFRKNNFYQFHVACVSYINLKLNKGFKEIFDKCLSNQFDGKKSAHMRKTLKHDSSRVTALIMF